ncbi:hypothetical protein [Metabacillus sp. RGM 3146]|uniref:hypothetical protein n=1 Tax=Metabacillus sp. RGM 3146 TaxID=3401092 RepID=UPI003B9A06D8
MIPNDYYNTYGYWSYADKYLSGQYVGFLNDYYIISDIYDNITGNKDLYVDTNSDRNNVFVLSNNMLYLQSRASTLAPELIKSHINEQAQLLSNEYIVLNSIGFGEAQTLDMNLLTDISLKANGQAKNAANQQDIISFFQEMSKNISSQYPILSNGYVKFSLPDNVAIASSATKIQKSGDSYIMYLNDLPFNPDPPTSGLTYNIPLVFSAEGEYTINFEVTYNGGDYKVNKSVKVNVKDVPLESINFSSSVLNIKVGDKVKLNDPETSLISFKPSNALNQLIHSIESNDSEIIRLTSENGIWTAEGVSQGYAIVTANALDKAKNFQAAIMIYVGANDTSSKIQSDNYKW